MCTDIILSIYCLLWLVLSVIGLLQSCFDHLLLYWINILNGYFFIQLYGIAHPSIQAGQKALCQNVKWNYLVNIIAQI